MEKSKKKYGLLGLLALVLIVPLAFILTACCGSLPYDVGTYVGTKRTVEGIEEDLTGTGTIIVLDDNYTGYMVIGGQRYNIEFTVDGINIIITYKTPTGEQQGHGTIENGTIIIQSVVNQSIETLYFEYDADYSQEDVFKYGRYNATNQIIIQNGDRKEPTPITDTDNNYITLNRNNTGTLRLALDDTMNQAVLFSYSVDSQGNFIMTVTSTGSSQGQQVFGKITDDVLTLETYSDGTNSMQIEFTFAE